MNTTNNLPSTSADESFSPYFIKDNIEDLFKNYYKFVCSHIYRLIPNPNLVEDLAQDIFMELWKKKEQIKIETSVPAYLRRTAVNKALNYIRKKKVTSDKDDDDTLSKIPSHYQTETMEYKELQEYINAAIETLPEKCRVVFMLSRFENYSYKQIAEELGIAVKTVENQISKALKVMRKALKKYESQIKHAA